MSKGYAVVLTLMVLAAALFAGWYSTTRVIYFPPELGDMRNGCDGFEDPGQPVLSQFETEWYSGVLRSMEEPSLYTAAMEGAPAALRFTWEPSFQPSRVVRIDSRPDGTRVMTVKIRSYGRQPMQTRQRVLSPGEIMALEAALTETRVLETPLKCVGGVDGARWIIEATDGRGGYTFVHSYSPVLGPVRQIGEHLMTLGGVMPERLY